MTNDTRELPVSVRLGIALLAGQHFDTTGVPDTEENRQLWTILRKEIIDAEAKGAVIEFPFEWPDAE